VLRVADATHIQGIVLNSPWGNDIAVSDGIAGPRMIEIGFAAPASAFEVWVEYASVESRPVSLLIDGTVALSAALLQTTTGWMPADQVWHRQISLSLAVGTHTISLRQAEGYFPHVRRLALLPVAAVVPSERVQAALERSIADHATLTEADVDSLVRGVAPTLRSLLALRRSRDAVTTLLAEIAAAAAADVAAPQDRTGFTGPFNGQRQRQAIFNRLDAAFGFDAMIETGAYFGTTTEMLAGLGRPVFSCELSRSHYLRSAVRLAGYSNVRLFNKDSRSFLRELFAEKPGWRMPFFYLDAHWNDDLPLPEELILIAQHQREFLVFVDDFHHPDPGYGYDRYPNGAEMTLDYLLPRIRTPQPLAFLVPSAPANTETGARRGTLIVVPQAIYDAWLSGEPLLMPATQS
jgi:hypothetical protein